MMLVLEMIEVLKNIMAILGIMWQKKKQYIPLT
jgi:hypothetical protein